MSDNTMQPFSAGEWRHAQGPRYETFYPHDGSVAGSLPWAR